MKRIIGTLMAIFMAASCFGLYVSAESSDDGLLFDFSYAEKNNGIVDKKNTATLVSTLNGNKEVLKIVPTGENSDDKQLRIDCYKLSYPVAEFAKARFMTVEYKYECPEQYENVGKMYVYITTGGKALKKSVTAYSMQDIKAGEWTTAVFDVSAIADSVDMTDGNIFKQFHLFPYGRDTDATKLSPDQVMYIGDISFYSLNPDKNAEYTVSFKSANPNAEGENPKALTVKRGDKYTLPENPYVLENAEFLGWKNSVDEKLYDPGTEFSAADMNVIFTAEFNIQYSAEEYQVLTFADYHGGSVDRRDNLIVTETEFQGKKVVKAVPNPKSEFVEKNMVIDGYRYNTSGIDIGKYDYLVITYYIEGALPKEVTLRVNVTTNGGTLTKSYVKESEEKLRSGRWEFAVIDLSGIDANLNLDLTEHMFKQMHIYPFYGLDCAEMTGNEAIYIGNLMFFKERPSLEVHESYMKGYEGALFKPSGNMTRAEACTVVARLTAGGDEHVPSDKTTSFTDVASDAWYHKYISYVESLGFLKSYSGEFLPDKAITRAEFVELVYNMGLLKDAGKNDTFTDVPADHPKAQVISAAGKAGLVNGYNNGDSTYSFMPDKTITRAEVVTVINNALSRNSKNHEISDDVKYFWFDVSSDFWAYADIAEATLPHVHAKDGWIFTMIPSISILGADNSKLNFAAGETIVGEIDETVNRRVSEIRSTETDIEVNGTTYYISESGNDSNDGKSPENAWKTIAKLESARPQMKSGDKVFFERGSTFRGRFSTVTGVTYSAYGEGAKPRLYGSPENGADPSKWTLLDDTTNIWVYKSELLDVGGIIINEGEIVGLKELPDLHDGKFYVRGSNKTKPYDIKTELNENYEFFSEVTDSNALSTATGKLYFRCDEGNPGELYEQIEFNTRGNIITNGKAENVHIDNLCIMYTGTHGIGSSSTKNLTVTNCEVGWIGGTLHNYDNGKATRLGNGIEIFGSCDGYIIDNCYVYQCYDAGITHQKRFGNEDNSMYNITYTNNIIEDCVYNIEYFNGDADNGKALRDGKNLLIKDNILRRAGYGWGNQRPDKNECAHIKSWTMRNEYEKGTYIIENNIFDRSSWKLVQTVAAYDAWCPIYRNNTYIQVIDKGLSEYKGLNLAFDCYAEIVIKTDMEDKTAKVYFLPESYTHRGFLTR